MTKYFTFFCKQTNGHENPILIQSLIEQHAASVESQSAAADQ